MLRGVLVVSLMVLSLNGHAQRYARANGSWTQTSPTIWASTPNGVAGSASVPTSSDDVYTNGFLVTVGANATCRNLNITYNLANSLSLSSLRILTVTGTLNGYDDAGAIEQIPTAAVLSFASGSSIVFTAANIQPAYDPYVIFFWDNTVPLGRVTFNLGGLSKNIIIPLSISTIARLQSGTLTADTGADLNGNSTATFQIDAGATFITNDPLTNFNNYQISGTLQTSGAVSAAGGAGSLSVNSGGLLTSTGSSGTISASTTTISGTVNTSNALNTTGTFQLNSTGVLNTSFSGVNQTEGWWSLSNRPSSTTIDPASTINYSSGSQNVYARSYPNLTLSGSGTKTVVGSGSINIAGNLLYSSSGITFTSPFQTIFDGSGAQSISGGGTANFNGGLQVNKSAGTLTLSQNISIQNGLTLTSGTIDFGSNTVSLSGNLSNNATLTAGASTLTITGATSVSGVTTTLNNLTVTGTGNFTAPATLNLTGNFTNNGTFNASTGNLVFNGSAGQTIGGSTNTSFYDITTNNSVSVSSSQSISGILTVNSGTFTTNGNLTLISNSFGDAAIGQVGGTISGNVTVQRYIPNSASSRVYRYLASPVVGANVGAWKTTFPITGTFADPNTSADFGGAFPTMVSSSPSMFYYNEPAGGAFTARFASYPINGNSTSSSPLTNGTGYAAFIRQTSPITLSVTGTVRQGNAPVTVTNLAGDPTDDGWNLIGNPYPSPISWSSVTIPSGVSGQISLKDNMGVLTGAGNYVTFSGGVGNPASFTGVIPVGEAFWVRRTTSGSTSITFKEADKVTNRNPTFLRQAAISNILRAKLTGANKQDELVIRLVADALDNVDNNYDAFKLTNDFLNFSSLSGDSKKLSINAKSTLDKGHSRKSFPFVIEGNGSWVPVGNFKISFSEFETFSDVIITLKDLYLKDSIEVSANQSEYSFTITSDPKTFANRFELSIARPAVTTSVEDLYPQNQINVYPNPTNGTFDVELPKNFNGSVKTLNNIGQEIGIIDLNKEGERLKGNFDLTPQSAGIYFVQVSDGSKVYTKKVIKK